MIVIKIDTKKIDLLIANMGMSAKEFSEHSGINESTLCKIRSGKQAPSLKTIGKLARALNVDAEQIAEK